MGSFHCFSYTKLHFPLHKCQKYPSYKESVYELWIFLDSSLNSVKLGILNKKSQLNNFNCKIYRHLRHISIYKSTTFTLGQSTIYSSVLINFDLQIYNFLTKINVDSTFRIVKLSLFC